MSRLKRRMGLWKKVTFDSYTKHIEMLSFESFNHINEQIFKRENVSIYITTNSYSMENYYISKLKQIIKMR